MIGPNRTQQVDGPTALSLRVFRQASRMQQPGRPETGGLKLFSKSYLLYERCARVATHFRRSEGRGAAW